MGIAEDAMKAVEEDKAFNDLKDTPNDSNPYGVRTTPPSQKAIEDAERKTLQDEANFTGSDPFADAYSLSQIALSPLALALLPAAMPSCARRRRPDYVAHPLEFL